MGGGGDSSTNVAVNPEFTGGATGDMKNKWGDNTGSNMVMNSGGGIATAAVAGVLGLAAITGVTVWLVQRAS